MDNILKSVKVFMLTKGHGITIDDEQNVRLSSGNSVRIKKLWQDYNSVQAASGTGISINIENFTAIINQLFPKKTRGVCATTNDKDFYIFMDYLFIQYDIKFYRGDTYISRRMESKTHTTRSVQGFIGLHNVTRDTKDRWNTLAKTTIAMLCTVSARKKGYATLKDLGLV